MLPGHRDHTLAGFFDKREFVEATITQLNKDLAGLAVNDLNFDFESRQVILDQLNELLVPVLLALTKRQPEQLSQFIYRVDLAEKNFFESLSGDPSMKDLAFRIIEREAQKVWLRLKFA